MPPALPPDTPQGRDLTGVLTDRVRKDNLKNQNKKQTPCSLSLETSTSFEYSTDVFRSYNFEEDEEIVNAQTTKRHVEQRAQPTAQSGNPRRTIQSDSFTGLGSSLEDDSARLGDWIPLEPSATSSGTSMLSPMTNPTLVRQTPEASGSSLTTIAEDGHARGGESQGSFQTLPSIVPDSQPDAPVEILTPSEEVGLCGRRSRWQRPHKAIDRIEITSSSTLENDADELQPAVLGSPRKGNDRVDQEPGQLSSQRSDTSSQTILAGSEARSGASQHPSQATTKSRSSGDIDSQSSWCVKTNQTPSEEDIERLPLHTSISTEQSSQDSLPKRRRLLPVLPPSSPSRLISQDQEDNVNYLHHGTNGSIFEKGDISFSMFKTLLPLQVVSPEPEATREAQSVSRVTPPLNILAQHEDLEYAFNPARKARELKKSERGYWSFKLHISDTDPIDEVESFSSTDEHHKSLQKKRSVQLDCEFNHWDFDHFKKFWNRLSHFVTSGQAGMTTWCICESANGHAKLLSDRHQSMGCVDARSEPVGVQVKVYTCGELAPHIWILLNIASNHMLEKLADVTFKDAHENIILSMD